MRLPDATRSELPELDAGVTVLRRESPRDTGFHRLVVSELADADEALWLDARNNASTYALYELAPARGRLDGLRIARAFTAYQHHTLATELAREATPATDLVVAPCLPALYRDDDVPDERARRLLRSTLAILEGLAVSCDAAILVTVTDDAVDGGDPHAETVLDVAEREIECRATRMGVAFEGDDYATPGYWARGGWQTTIPYWAELCGTVPRIDRAAAIPVAAPNVDAAGAPNVDVADEPERSSILDSFDGGMV